MIAFMAATGCHRAELSCIFWLAMVSSEPVTLHVKPLFFFRMRNFTFISSEFHLPCKCPISLDICVKIKPVLRRMPLQGLFGGLFLNYAISQKLFFRIFLSPSRLKSYFFEKPSAPSLLRLTLQFPNLSVK